MKSAIGEDGSRIKRYRYWPPGSFAGKPSGEKKWTPAITVPQIRQGIAGILYEALQWGTKAHMLQECQKRWQRNELARFYPHKRRNVLAPLNLDKRQF
jgi:hypothetical protein